MRQKSAGGEPEVIIRLAVFRDLNVSSWTPSYSILILSADGLCRPPGPFSDSSLLSLS